MPGPYIIPGIQKHAIPLPAFPDIFRDIIGTFAFPSKLPFRTVWIHPVRSYDLSVFLPFPERHDRSRPVTGILQSRISAETSGHLPVAQCPIGVLRRIQTAEVDLKRAVHPVPSVFQHRIHIDVVCHLFRKLQYAGSHTCSCHDKHQHNKQYTGQTVFDTHILLPKLNSVSLSESSADPSLS